jgi:hypothetical protein
LDIRLYSLDKCGYYKRGATEPEYGDIVDWWMEFTQWIRDRTNVADTATFTQSKRTTTQVYCTNTVEDDDGNFGVTLWNRIPDTEEGVAYITVDSTVGNVEANAQALPGTDAIPGWPAYLWYMPSYKVLAALVPDNMRGFRSTGMPQAREYFRQYLCGHSPRHVAKQRIEDSMTEATYEILGYRRTPMEEPDLKITPYFETSLWYQPGLPSKIRENASEINKLVTETTVNTLQPTETKALDTLLSGLGGDTVSRAPDEKAKYRMSVDWEPRSEQDVERLINDWKQREDRDNYSVGVQFRGSSKIYWLGRIDGKGTVDVPTAFSNKRLWRDEEVRNAWEQARPEITALLEATDSQEGIS